uniref:Uncharacterized protein n=1 Tax=Acrobeloides nanus TaxID=290746 RepID=A0A914C9G4_9BILA
MKRFKPLFVIAFSLFILCVNSEEAEDDETFEPFDIPLEELQKESRKITTLTEECKKYQEHYKYYCVRSNIGKYNEEVRIICERYELLCRDRIPPTVDHIRRQKIYWRTAGVPKAIEKKLVNCYSSCRENDPLCVHACECIFLNWIMQKECEPGVKATAIINCERWFTKCKAFWKPLPDLTPYPYGVHAPPPILRGVFYGYDGLGNAQVYNRPRDHGISMWRGTNTLIVDWPDGKVAGATTFDIPFAGVEGVYNAYDVGFPNIAKFYSSQLGLRGTNPGTGRRRFLK